MLHFDNVSIAGRLSDVNLYFAQNRFVGVIGGNGAGKSTLARLMVGSLIPDCGEVRLGMWRSNVFSERQEILRRVALVRSDPELQIVAPTVFEEVAFGLRMARLPAQRLNDIVCTTLERFALNELADVHPLLLSLGEQQRLALAAQIVRNPQYLILDETTSMMDSIVRTDLLRMLRQWQITQRACLVLVTHRLDEVTEADEIVVLMAGQVAMQGSTSEVLARIQDHSEWRVELPPLLAIQWG